MSSVCFVTYVTSLYRVLGMMKINFKNGPFITAFWIALCTLFGLPIAAASEIALHEKAAIVKAQLVAVRDNNETSSALGHDEKDLKKKLGVKSLIGSDLSGADLRWLYLQEADLSQANLQGADLAGTNLRNTNLQGADLRGANLSGANLKEADFRGANLTSVQNLNLNQIFVTIYDKETKFPDGITFEDIPKYNKDRLMSVLGVKTLVRAQAQGKVLRWGDFKAANMQWSSLQRADLTGANLSEANLSATNLRGSNLSEANLQNAILKNANLQGANLTQANLKRADLTGTSLQGANLTGVNFHEAKLLAANLTGANLSGADMNSADLRGADLREVRNITIMQLAQAIVDRRTRLPEGITFKQIE